jgi:catechol 2,3-dioxygenase-like lactoylglutathione lyase family enzyme
MHPDRPNGLQSLSLHNLAFTVSDLEQTIQWYGDILGFKVLNRVTFPAIGAQVAFLQHADVRLEVLQAPGGFRINEMFADAPAHLLPIGNKVLVLQVNDLHTATQELEEKGVTFAWKEVDLTGDGTFSTMIRDSDGNFINIFQRALAEQVA